MRLLQGLTACASVGIAAYLVLDLRAQQAEVARLRADVGSLTHAIGEVRPRASVRETTGQIAARPMDRAPDAPAPTTPESSADAPSALSAARAPLEPAEVLVRFNTKFSEEYLDARWAQASQATATTKLSAVLPPTSALTSVECRASMCKFETTHQDIEHYQQFARSAFMEPATAPWNGGFFSTGTEDPATGKFVAVAYFTREGEALPQFE